MKVVFTGVYLDGTGWGKAANDYILALDAAGVDVVPRPIVLGGGFRDINPRVAELEKKDPANADVIVQNILPHLMRYNSRTTNVGLCFFETSNFYYTSWVENLNLMDATITPTVSGNATCKNSGVTKPLHVVPVPTNVDKFINKYQPIGFKDKNKFTFYTIGEWTKRKNIAAILKAFHTEFDTGEPVEIILKTTPTGLGNNPKEFIDSYIKEVKMGLKLYPRLEDYRQEKIVCDYWPDDKVYGIHQSCDCFVSASFGEGWCVPAFDAMGFGKTPIVPFSTAFTTYIGPSTGYLVDTHEENCFGHVTGLGDLYTAHENWWVPSTISLRQQMRVAYENHSSNNQSEKSKAGRERVFEFSYDKIGKQFKDTLEKCMNQKKVT